jgi:hypothetical protein
LSPLLLVLPAVLALPLSVPLVLPALLPQPATIDATIAAHKNALRILFFILHSSCTSITVNLLYRKIARKSLSYVFINLHYLHFYFAFP